jgi:hypothetical protein
MKSNDKGKNWRKKKENKFDIKINWNQMLREEIENKVKLGKG